MNTKTIEYYLIELSDFQKNVSRLTKKKKFTSLISQVEELEENLEKGNFPGILHKRSAEPKPYEVYKLRMANPDANVGKSNGYRIFYLVVTEHKIVVMLTIYYKKKDETVADTYIEGLITGYFLDAMPYDETEDDTA